MTEQTSPIPPIYGYIAQPKYDPKTGQTVYVANGQPVLMPVQTPQGQIYVVHNINTAPIPKANNTNENKDTSLMGTLNSIGQTIHNASGTISREFNQMWNNLFK